MHDIPRMQGVQCLQHTLEDVLRLSKRDVQLCKAQKVVLQMVEHEHSALRQEVHKLSDVRTTSCEMVDVFPCFEVLRNLLQGEALVTNTRPVSRGTVSRRLLADHTLPHTPCARQPFYPAEACVWCSSGPKNRSTAPSMVGHGSMARTAILLIDRCCLRQISSRPRSYVTGKSHVSSELQC